MATATRSRKATPKRPTEKKRPAASPKLKRDYKPATLWEVVVRKSGVITSRLGFCESLADANHRAARFNRWCRNVKGLTTEVRAIGDRFALIICKDDIPTEVLFKNLDADEAERLADTFNDPCEGSTCRAWAVPHHDNLGIDPGRHKAKREEVDA